MARTADRSSLEASRWLRGARGVNVLGLELVETWYLALVLTVDGQPLHELLEDGLAGIPAYLVRSGLPVWGNDDPAQSETVFLVTVCSCTEWGCGHSRCTVRREGDRVHFADFSGSPRSPRPRRFEFAAAQFDAIVARMIVLGERARAERFALLAGPPN